MHNELFDELTRRDFLRRLALTSALLAGCRPAGSGASASVAAPRRRRLLCFTKSSGFEHSVVRRGADGSLSLVERTLTAMGERDGFDVECTKDGSIFGGERLRDFDAFFFFTSGMLTQAGTDKHPPMTPEGKAALLDAVRGGKGFVAAHAATDSFHTQPDDPADRSNRYVTHYPAVDPYIAMLGGEFIKHGRIQPGRVVIADARFPGVGGFVAGGDHSARVGEWYSLKEFAPDMRVIMVLDTAGMTGPEYDRGPFPVTWARRHGAGRVFYTALGHREEEWQEQALPALVSGALRWAFGDVAAPDLTPNLAAAAPRAAELPKR